MWYFPYEKSIPLNNWPRTFLVWPFSTTYIKLKEMPKFSVKIPIVASRFNILEYYDKVIQGNNVCVALGSLLNLSSFVCFVSESALHVARYNAIQCTFISKYNYIFILFPPASWVVYNSWQRRSTLAKIFGFERLDDPTIYGICVTVVVLNLWWTEH